MEIGILIGSDRPRAIMPREIIPGEDDSPYALRSDLGWGIIGKISQPLSGEDGDADEIGVSHRIYTIETCEPLDPQADLEGPMTMESRGTSPITEFTTLKSLTKSELSSIAAQPSWAIH